VKELVGTGDGRRVRLCDDGRAHDGHEYLVGAVRWECPGRRVDAFWVHLDAEDLAVMDEDRDWW
jgi:hypothetical protein